MLSELKNFEKLSWENKIKYILWFYKIMISKTNNLEYIAKFKNKIDEVKWYEEDENNISKLTKLYGRIITAKEKTKLRKISEIKKNIEKQKQQIALIKANEDDKNPDEYLAQALTKI